MSIKRKASQVCITPCRCFTCVCLKAVHLCLFVCVFHDVSLDIALYIYINIYRYIYILIYIYIPRKINMSPKKGPFLKRDFILQPSIFTGQVSLQRGICRIIIIDYNIYIYIQII